MQGAFILDAPFFVERFFGSRRVSASSLDCSAYIPVTPPDEYFVSGDPRKEATPAYA
jgi:hypothetical protein